MPGQLETGTRIGLQNPIQSVRMLYFALKLAPRTLDNEMATRLDNRKGLQPSGWLERRFRLSLRDTSVATEFRAAVATFMVMAYIIFANAGTLGTLADSRGESLAFPAVLTVTCLSAGCLCILMGLFANVPFALAPGMGLNAVVTFQLVGQMKLTWPQAMTVIFVEGTLILLLVLTRFREAVMNAIPLSQKRAIGAGIGMFIALIGFVRTGCSGKGNRCCLGVSVRPPDDRVCDWVSGDGMAPSPSGSRCFGHGHSDGISCCCGAEPYGRPR
jgi:hypothetical protein